jgi:hypothetical protein
MQCQNNLACFMLTDYTIESYEFVSKLLGLLLTNDYTLLWNLVVRSDSTVVPSVPAIEDATSSSRDIFKMVNTLAYYRPEKL